MPFRLTYRATRVLSSLCLLGITLLADRRRACLYRARVSCGSNEELRTPGGTNEFKKAGATWLDRGSHGLSRFYSLSCARRAELHGAPGAAVGHVGHHRSDVSAHAGGGFESCLLPS